jgi:hypothetical protein
VSKETTFEVLSIKNNEWQTDTIYSDREEAIEAARSLYGNPHIDGAKVISEVYDDKTGKSKETTIFNTTTKLKAKKSSPDKNSSIPSRESRVTSSKPKQITRGKDAMVAVKAAFWLFLILAGGLAVLYGFEGLNAFLNKLK